MEQGVLAPTLRAEPLAAAQVLAARLLKARVPWAQVQAAPALEPLVDSELWMEPVQAARAPEQLEVLVPQGPTQVEAQPLGAAPEVEQESVRAGLEAEPELEIRPEELAALRHRAGAVQQARASLLPERWV